MRARPARRWLAGDNLVTEQQHPLRRSSDRRLKVFDSVDDDRPRSAALHGWLSYSVDVRVISVATGRFIWRVGDLVVEGLPQLMMARITSSPWHWGETFCPWKWKLSELIVIVESLH